MGKLRFRVYINCSRSQRNLAFLPWHCKRRMCVEPTILPETRGPPFPASLTMLSSSTLLPTLLWVGVLLWIPAPLRTSGWGRGGDSCSQHPGHEKEEGRLRSDPSQEVGVRGQGKEVCQACRMKARGPHGKGSSGVTVFPHWVVSRNSEVSVGPGVSGFGGLGWECSETQLSCELRTKTRILDSGQFHTGYIIRVNLSGLLAWVPPYPWCF